MGAAVEIFEFFLRLAFFAAVPRVLVRLAELYPVTGALVQIAISIGVLFAGEAAKTLASKSRIASIVLKKQLKFDAYYAERPPGAFLYYVFYPLFAPYWLFNPEARQELLLYKGYTLGSIAILLVSLGVQYATMFPPELGLDAFLPIAGKTLAIETVVVLCIVMPMATTFVTYHKRNRWALVPIVIAGVVSASSALAQIHARRDPVVSYATRARLLDRTAAAPAKAEAAEEKALRAAWAILAKRDDEVDSDGKVTGDDALVAAHEALATFYRNDEAHAFDLWRRKIGKETLLVVYFETWRGRQPIWLAFEHLPAGGTPKKPIPASDVIVKDAKKLPRGAFDAMFKATR
jgi:hypothetical protein